MKFAELNPALEADGHKLSFECPLHRPERWGVTGPVPIANEEFATVQDGVSWKMTGTLPDISLDASIQLHGFHDGHPCKAHFSVNNGVVTVHP